jgi:guanylate kinase
MEEIEYRMRHDETRVNMNEEEFQKRLAQARIDIESWPKYCRYSVVNTNGHRDKMVKDFVAKVKEHYRHLF